MIYLFFDEDCSLICNNAEQNLSSGNKIFLKNAKYKFEEVENEDFLFVSPFCLPITTNFYKLCYKNLKQKNAICVKHEQDFYIFLKFSPIFDCFYTQFSFKGALVGVCLSSEISISINGNIKFSTKNCQLKFSHYEQKGDFCFIHFVGKTNFVAILKGQELAFADYYHQANINKNELYFLTKLCDSLNHGRVCHFKDNKLENYLVYLDDEELNLKQEFLPCVFLDCLLAGNYKYCNMLLAENLKHAKPERIKDFFCEFDKFYFLKPNCCALLKKDALAGICEFEILNDKIVNEN